MRTHHWIIGAGVILILAAVFIFLVPHTDELARPGIIAASSTAPVYVHDSYKKGTHTLTVTIGAPNPCISVTAQASVIPGASSTPDIIAIAVEMPIDTGICLQEPATTTLTLTAAASSKATFEASINGESTTVVQQ